MKKIIKIFAITTILILMIWPAAVYADSASDPSSTLCPEPQDMPQDNCITDGERKGKVITILEEGMALPGNSEDAKIRQCLRVTKTNNCEEEGKKPSSKTVYIKGTNCPTDATCEKVTVIIAPGGVDLITIYVEMIYKWAASIAGIVCVLIMIVSGIQISAAGGDTQGVESAKKRIFQSLTALIVLFMSAFILYLINPSFFTV